MIDADFDSHDREHVSLLHKIAPISFVAIACAMGSWVFDPLAGAFTYNQWISALYIPAGIKVIAMLALGVSATVGIFFGTLAWNIFGTHTQIGLALIFATMTAASCYASYCVIKISLHGRGRYQWLPFSLSQTFLLVLLYSCINAGLHHLFFAVSATGGGLTLTSYFTMVFGDVAGALSLYVCLNLATAGWLEFVRWWHLRA